MKKILATPLLAMVVFLSVSASSAETYKNKIEGPGFEISYPLNWSRVTNLPRDFSFDFLIKRSTRTLLISEEGTIAIGMRNFTGNKEELMRELRGDGLQSHLGNFIPTGVRVHDVRDSYLGKSPAYEILIVIDKAYLQQSNQFISEDLLFTYIFSIRRNRLYGVTFGRYQNRMKEVWDEGWAIVDSFKFK